jgi:hypothetical protein
MPWLLVVARACDKLTILSIQWKLVRGCVAVHLWLISREFFGCGGRGKETSERQSGGRAAAVARREKMATCCAPRSPKDHALS